MAVAWHVNIRMMSIALPESILAINAPANISSGIAPSALSTRSRVESKRVDEFANISDEELRQYVYGTKELDA